MPSSITITPLTPTIGALVQGAALSQKVSEKVLVTIRAALSRHRVLFFRNHPITPVEQRDLAGQFGTLHIHPIYPHAPEAREIIVLDTDADHPPDNDNWHTDVTFSRTPPKFAFLAAKSVPEAGGDTLWSDSVSAFRALSTPLQQLLSGLHAEHDIAKSFPASRFARTVTERDRWEKAISTHPPQVHPVVRTHPETGEPALFVNQGFTTRITELPPDESQMLLRFLFQHISRPEFTIRWHWHTNDLAIWDNQVTQHYATADYLPARRIMHRATVLGDVPYYSNDAWTLVTR